MYYHMILDTDLTLTNLMSVTTLLTDQVVAANPVFCVYSISCTVALSHHEDCI